LRVLTGTEEEKKTKAAKYPPILAGDQVIAELEAIKLNVSAANK